METMVEIRATFFEECAEELEALSNTLPILMAGEPDAETVAVAYRAVHSIKGGAASFKLSGLSAFAKTFESLLGEVRAGRMECDADVVALIGRCADGLALHVESARATAPLVDDIRARVALTDPDAAMVVDADGEEPTIDFAALGFVPVSVEPGAFLPGGGPNRFEIVFAPRASMYASANEASVLLRETLALGSGRVTVDADALPAIEDLDPEGAHLSFRIELETDEDEDAVRDIFSFVEDDCELVISRVEPPKTLPDAEEGDPQALFAALLAVARS